MKTFGISSQKVTEVEPEKSKKKKKKNKKKKKKAAKENADVDNVVDVDVDGASDDDDDTENDAVDAEANGDQLASRKRKNGAPEKAKNVKKSKPEMEMDVGGVDDVDDNLVASSGAKLVHVSSLWERKPT